MFHSVRRMVLMFRSTRGSWRVFPRKTFGENMTRTREDRLVLLIRKTFLIWWRRRWRRRNRKWTETGTSRREKSSSFEFFSFPCWLLLFCCLLTVASFHPYVY